MVPTLVYHFLFEWFMNGQTPGKRALKIKVTNDDGSATRVGAYFLRWLLRPIDLIFYGGVGALCILLTKKHQRLGDMAAGTVVVQTRPKQSVFRSDYYTFPPNYQPKYPQAASLTPGQIQLISQMLSAAPRFSDEIKLQTLAQKVREIVRIDESTVGSTTDNRRFLENIIRDYHYYDSLGI